MKAVFSIFVITCVVGVFGGKFPANLPQCRAADLECLPRVITQIVQSSPNGQPGLSIPPLEPLHINKIDILQGSTSPIAVNLKFKDLDLTGISQAVVTKVVGFEADPLNSKFEVYATVPRLTVNGNYKVNGQVLVLPIQGEGKSNLIFDNANLVVKYKPRIVTKNGKNYVQTDTFKLDFDTTRLHINLENLFNGDKVLGDNMNLFLNENWRDILNELKPAITLAMEEILKSIINRIFMKIPYEDIYLPS